MNQQFIEYIRSELAQGMREADIAANLAIQGWPAETIQEAFTALGYRTEAPTPNRRFAWFRRTSKPHRVEIVVCATALFIAAISGVALAYRAVIRHHAAMGQQSPKSVQPEMRVATPVASTPCKASPYPLRAGTAHPLAQYAFPENPIPYPQNYPSALRLPESYQSVEISGMPEAAPHLWTTKIRVARPSCDVTEQLISIFKAKGWHVETQDLGAGAAFLVISTQSADRSGEITIDPERDNEERTRAILIFSY